ncbi:uncharacterized protein LOC100888754 isoform X1 [Strongylocentrotus purpuratus]|uniref:Uncharacterized protein n=2 Tax=Strongylocentrotus purpuratus TaxID=7668 RepID=A0A7M7GNC6_STRPU|nr:uncharacterized protein LOC100888754 isoform X1 [Strongylocentrotus purpuratus]|eukprot:XP_003723477.1 PREDICTED: uncharacterized protein LOC100888754 isoform X1 [Strongylocentrotus purpuratus]
MQKRKLVDGEVTPPRGMLDVMQCRFPACTIKAWKHGTDECHWRSMTPVCIKEGKTETEYEITDWIGLGRQRQMSNTELVPDQIKQTITRILEPLESLYLDKETKSWKYKTDTGVLSIEQQHITQGFVSDMSNSRGRSMISTLLTQLFSSDTSVKVMNIGGSSTANEPSVRKLVFEVTFEEGESDSSPPESPAAKLPTPTRCSPRVSQTAPLLQDAVCRQVFKFIPDIVLESTSKEHLLVEIKKGKVLSQSSVAQFRYMLMPAAIKQGSAVGVLICSNQALLEKCILADSKVRFERNYFEFSDHSLVADMESLCSIIYIQAMR